MLTTTNHLIFWLPGWSPTTNTVTLQGGNAPASEQLPSDYVPTIEQFFRDESGTSLYNVYTQYCQGVPSNSTSCPQGSQFIRNSATYGGAVIITEPYPSTDCFITSNNDCVTDGTVQNVIRNAIDSQHWSSGLQDMFYVVTAPNESICKQALTAHTCVGGQGNPANGQHDFFHTGLAGTGPEVIYAEISPGTALPGGPHNPQTDAALSALSHEQAEAITDPDNGGWWGSAGGVAGETGDECLSSGVAFQHWNGHTYLLQGEWSNQDNACVKGDPRGPEIKPTTASAMQTNLSACTANTLSANDDGSAGAVSLRFPLNFFGRTFNQLYVNNNGNVTFDGPVSTFTPFGLQGTSREIIAPYFADVDTRGPGSGVGSIGVVTYGGAPASGGNPAYFCVNWPDVGYYASHTDKTNSFQLVLIDRSVQTGTPGDFDIVFNYDNITWETGDASGGTNGIGGASARVGYSNGTSRSLELPGSGVPGAVLDGGANALTAGGLNSATTGRFIFPVRNGTVPTGGTVQGTVRDDASPARPVAGASVQVCAAGGGCHLTATNPAGGYTVPALADATYTVTVFPPSGDGLAEGFGGPVTVAGGATLQADVTLHSLSPLPRGTTLTHHSVNSDGTPVLDWRVAGTLSTQGCIDGQGTVSIAGTNAYTHAPMTQREPLTETPSGSGRYVGSVPALYPMAGPATFSVRFACQNGAQVLSFSVYVDPSGQVVDQNGNPVVGATVTLLRSDNASGPFGPVPAGSTVMSPGNRATPDTTGSDGRFGWDVVVGYYEIQASKSGCTALGNPLQQTVQAGPLQVPPPIADLRLTLSCPQADPTITNITGRPISAVEGSPYTGIIATFTDPDTSATPGEYSATVDWGDGTMPDAATTITKDASGVFLVEASHTYSEESSHSVKVTITDGDNPSNRGSVTSTATVNDATLTSQCTVPGTSVQWFTGSTASFTDADANGMSSDYTATIDWGDGSSSPGSVSAGTGRGPYTVSGSHSFSSTGTFTATTTIKDAGGSRTLAACHTLVFAFASGGGAFVIGDKSSAIGTAVTFWGAQWWKLNSLTGGAAPASFKGFANNPSIPRCGTDWSTGPGNSASPPNSPLPAHMGVIVSSTITKAGSATSGNTMHLAVVKTDPGYGPDPSRAGTGTVEAQAC